MAGYSASDWEKKLIGYYLEKRGYSAKTFESGSSSCLFFISEDGKFAGAGFLHGMDNYDDFSRVFSLGEKYLINEGIKRYISPINFSTWYDYRIITSRYRNPQFPGEKITEARLKSFFEKFAFREAEKYFSFRITDTAGVLSSLERSSQRFVSCGGTLEEIDGSKTAEVIHDIYRISRDAFSEARYFTDISFEEFSTVYALAPKSAAVKITAAKLGGKMIGFLLSNLENGRISLKTIAVLKEHRNIFAAPALIRNDYVFAAENGIKEVFHAYMRNDISTHNFSKLHGEIYREYSLYEREI